MAREVRAADKLLLSSIRDSYLPLTLYTLARLLGAAAGIALPLSMAAAVDAVVDRESVEAAIGLLAAVSALLVLCEMAALLSGAYCSARATARLRQLTARRLMAARPSEIETADRGGLAMAIISGAPEASGAPVALVQSAIAVLTGVGAIAVLGFLDIWSLVAYLAVAPLGLLVVHRFMVRGTAASHDYQRAQARLAGHLINSLNGARTIAVSKTADREIDRILGGLADLGKAGRAFWESMGRASKGGEFLVPLLQAVVLAVAGIGVAGGRLTPGVLAAVVLYAAQGLAVFDQVGVISAIARARAGARQVASVVSRSPIRYGDLEPGEHMGELRLESVTVYGKDGRPVLDSASLVVPRGTVVAVVGDAAATRCICWLAARLTDPDHGRVYLSGVDLRELSEKYLRSVVGFAPTTPHLFGETLADAVSSGRKGGSERLTEAAKSAGIAEYVSHLPGGWRTPLEDVALSDGERQRLGMARAFYGRPCLLVAEDVTSNLDTVTERLVQGALTTPLGSGSRLLATRRRAVAERCDLVVWVSDARIRAVGTHAELCESPGYRAALVSTGGAEGENTVMTAGELW
ncbi:ABC transporter transmembrane domain-containing protein [Nocardiopsis algeriensis]|uniref:ATP-binding cassette subfamily B protein n=1 Tax=Nocardiopsis algeriensis TaxID=1478215 RepID=A0A841INY2_9ACTN|nr:ABC transporter ATP-binding protein [Nocardiopsis algeriensis]MBB6119814.1 ATP-binding cassette subfamily B protein [Nocardiopsis algeriensis]